MSSLHTSAADGTLLTLDELDAYRQSIGAVFDIDELDGKGRTALSYCAAKGHVSSVRLLINEGANVNKMSKHNRSALWYACFSPSSSISRQNRFEILSYLLDKGAEIDAQAQDGTTPLMRMIEHRDKDIIRFLVDRGASTTITRGPSGPSVEEIAQNTNDESIIMSLKNPEHKTNISIIVDSIIIFILWILGFLNEFCNGAIRILFGIAGTDLDGIRKSMQDMAEKPTDQPQDGIPAEDIASTSNDETGDLQAITESHGDIPEGHVDTETKTDEAAEAPEALHYSDDSQSESSIENSNISIATSLVTSIVESETTHGDSSKPTTEIIDLDENADVREAASFETAEDFKDSMLKYIDETNLRQFFAEGDTFLQDVAERAMLAKHDPTNLLRSDEDLSDLTSMALYQPVLFCDDSGSMYEGSRFKDQCALAERIVRISTRLVPDGFGTALQFINRNCPFDCRLTADDVHTIIKQMRPRGNTKIGTSLQNKILTPLVYDVLNKPDGKLERPILISIITDGSPAGEAPTKFRETILNCIEFLEEKNYTPTAVRFQVSQIGDDASAKEFLRELQHDPRLQDVLYCTTQRLDEEYQKLHQQEEDLERWLLQTLMKPIMDRTEF